MSLLPLPPCVHTSMDEITTPGICYTCLLYHHKQFEVIFWCTVVINLFTAKTHRVHIIICAHTCTQLSPQILAVKLRVLFQHYENQPGVHYTSAGRQKDILHFSSHSLECRWIDSFLDYVISGPQQSFNTYVTLKRVVLRQVRGFQVGRVRPV